jgi:protoheme IX farnesyltransferase
MKPRVMALAVFTALVGFMIAPGHLDPMRALVAILAIAAGAGAAGVLNMWYEADIDAAMARTAGRPIPRGKISRAEALVSGLVLAVGAVAALALAVNVEAAALLAFTIFFYIVVYTIWLKRRTPQNIVIGGAAGALPPVIGWAAATGDIALEPLVMFLIIFLWTPPHFWTLALKFRDDYAAAGVPMLPVVAAPATVARKILLYSYAMVAATLVLSSYAGWLYGCCAVALGSWFLIEAHSLGRRIVTQGAPASMRLFHLSIAYLTLLFAAIAVTALLPWARW